MSLRTGSFIALSAFSLATSAAPQKPKGIRWTSCPEFNKNMTALTEATTTTHTPFQCGKLSVPLDYTKPDSKPLGLDLFRVQATQEPVLGTILFNPGGPGETAAESLPAIASDLKASVGEQYHIMSWDPRGTGNTIPFICPEAAGESDARAPGKRDMHELVKTNLTEYFVSGGWETAGSTADACYAQNNETGSFIGTVSTARDMLEIVEALGEDGLLRFYGASYGTVLGHYFATLFPERVERMVLDGTVEPDAYRQGHYGDNIRDADAVVDGVFHACAQNKAECGLAQFLQANCTRDIYDGLNAILDPATAGANEAEIGAALAEFKVLLFTGGLYYPSMWPVIDASLVALLNKTTSKTEGAAKEESWSYNQALGAGIGIRGADATLQPKSAEVYLLRVQQQASVSSFSDIWYINSWVAAQWKMAANERFFGNFTAQTRHPILYVNGKHDPVTPLAMAETASRGYEGSVVLAHGGYGHTSAANPSSCVHEHVQAYFRDGRLPAPETFCEPDLEIYELSKARQGRMLGAL